MYCTEDPYDRRHSSSRMLDPTCARLAEELRRRCLSGRVLNAGHLLIGIGDGGEEEGRWLRSGNGTCGF